MCEPGPGEWRYRQETGPSEIERLRDEVKRLTRERDGFRASMDHDSVALGTALARAEAAEAEVATLRATVERVKALAASPTAYFEADGSLAEDAVPASTLRAALRTGGK